MTLDSATAAAIATNRFGLGARPGELVSVGADPQGWLLAQVEAPYRAPAPLDGLASGREVLASYYAVREAREAARKRARSDAEVAKAALDTVRERILPHYTQAAVARTRAALLAADSFRERLVHFWSNHFAVSIDKPICLGTAGALENEAIRPHVCGHFADLLYAVETHPAMITYLDNQQSVGPNSEFLVRGRRFRRFGGEAKNKIGLNENLAREILELHTLGVDGGYTQADVTTFAAVITGWSVGGGKGRLAEGEPGRFVFRTFVHEPGAKTVLGRRYADAGFEQGVHVLGDLARHPATAHHVATKLARHFVGDDPPRELIDRLAHAFVSTGGHLPDVYAALIRHDDAWTPEPRKFKTPADFVYSTFRALELEPKDPKKLLAGFELLGQRNWSPGSPAGWPDREADWDGADAVMKRIEWSVAVADRLGNAHSAVATADVALGPLAGEHTRSALARASSGSQALTLLLMSPEFQRR